MLTTEPSGTEPATKLPHQTRLSTRPRRQATAPAHPGRRLPPSVYRRRRLLVAAAGLGVVLAAAFAIDTVAGIGEIGRNVRVGGVDVSSLDREAATVRLDAAANYLLDQPVTLSAAGKDLEVTPRELGATIDVRKSVDAAFAARSRANPLDWLASWWAETDPGFKGVKVPARKVDEVLAPYFSAVETPPQNATFAVDGATVTVQPAVAGRGVNLPKATRDIETAMQARGEARRVEVPLSRIEPERSTEEARAMQITEPVASFTTNFKPGEARVKNIVRIAELVDGAVIDPGAKFSLNKTSGPRTVERGFVPAPVIYDGEFDEDVGGGVSQFATTLFNAAFFAGVPLKEHKAHSFYISRYPLGREATLSWPHPDVVFVNDYATHLLVKASVGTSSVTVTLYGKKDGREVTTETGPRESPTRPKISCVKDPEVAPGQERVRQSPAPGFSVQITRTITRPGSKAQTESYVTVYSPKNKVIGYNPVPNAKASQATGPGGGASPPVGTTQLAPASPAPAPVPAPAPPPPTRCPGIDGTPL
jgi:vancomycin resistance protein YoaR